MEVGRPRVGRSAGIAPLPIWAILHVSQWYVDNFGRPETNVPSLTVIVEVEGLDTIG